MPSKPLNGTVGNCRVEQLLGSKLSLELDTFLADPKQWPKAVFDGWKLPPGQLPSTFRSWGAVKLGMEWCASRGIEVTKRTMASHYRDHVPIVPYSPEDFAQRALDHRAEGERTLPTNVISYQEVYQKGLTIGHKAIDMLEQRIDALAAKGEHIPTDLLLKLADLGTKLATSQASIMARGLDLSRQKDDEIEGFRSGSMPLPSQRFGHSRVRVVDGVSQPVHDEGPADRAEYSARAREQGSIELPHPG